MSKTRNGARDRNQYLLIELLDLLAIIPPFCRRSYHNRFKAPRRFVQVAAMAEPPAGTVSMLM
jgi:hypothetical protein